MISAAQPATHGLPIWRATTAACDVAPPRAVSTPCAAAMPWKSSGDVSMRTRMTFSPCCAISNARSALKTALPTAAPGDAFSPAVSFCAEDLAVGSNWSRSSWSTCAGSMRDSASRSVMMPSSTMSAAMRTAAAAVRLADARLEHEQPAALDRELEVLHVAVVALQAARDVLELARTSRASASRILLIARGVRMPATTSSPWALVRYSP